jgi:DNA-binding response OmpR family regulator
MMLEHAGYRVLQASNGEEGLRLLETNDVDLVIMDYWLPDLDGAELITRIREMDARVLLAVLTGSVEALDVPTEAGVFRVLSKPIQPETLRAVVEEMLRGRAAA